ncbi:hypothetical protein Tco_0017932 [Tanacetum coccineum]
MPTEMELTLEQTQQGVSYEVSFDESDTYVLEIFDTLAGNPVKEILLKLNLPDHSILKDGHGDFRYSDTVRLSRSDEVLKLKNIKKDGYTSFQAIKSRKVLKITYSHTSQDKGTSSSLKSMITTQRSKTKDQLLHKRTQDQDKKLQRLMIKVTRRDLYDHPLGGDCKEHRKC